jgi:tetratricopeptide (TPR) repeat protein
MNPGPDIDLQTDSGRERLLRIGPGGAGILYRTEQAWYRVFPGLVKAALRNELKAQIGRKYRGCIAPVQCKLQPETGWFFVRYEATEDHESFENILQSRDVVAALEGVAAVLRALPTWWQAIPPPIMPTPSDIVITDDGQALLLLRSDWRLPPIEELLAEPDRTPYLAPELFRSGLPTTLTRSKATDLHAAGVTLLRCFFKHAPYFDAADALLSAATGGASQWRSWRDNLPFWLDQLNLTDHVIGIGRQMTAFDPNDRHFDLQEVANFISAYRLRMVPVTALRETKREGIRKAFELFKALLLESESYELLIEGGDLSSKLGNLSQAIYYYERAINLDPDRPDAYRRQFDLIASANQNPISSLSVQYRSNIDYATSLDRRIRRDFDQLVRVDVGSTEDRELSMARHYLWRGREISTQFHSAEEFVKRRIRDSAGKLMGWKLELRLVACEAALEMGNMEDADKIYRDVYQDIQKYRNRTQVDQQMIRRASEYAGRLYPRLASQHSTRASESP